MYKRQIQTLHIVPEYNEELIYPAICKSMEALHIATDLRPEMKIVIKPNLVMAKSPDFPATTHPLVIKAVIRWLREQGMQHITIAESSGGLYNAEAMKHVYHVCGMDTPVSYTHLFRRTGKTVRGEVRLEESLPLGSVVFLLIQYGRYDGILIFENTVLTKLFNCLLYTSRCV